MWFRVVLGGWALLLLPTTAAGALYPPAQGPMRELVIAGKPSAAVVLVDQASPVERQAAAELVECIRKMSGVTLPVTSEAPTNVIRIFLGAAARQRLSWPGTGQDLGEDGFIVRSLPEGLAIAGEGDLGTLFGVYGFLEECLGVRWLRPGQWGTVIPRRASVRIGDIEMQQRPSFAVRWIGNDDWSLHNRCNVNLTVAAERLGVRWDPAFHSFADLMPRSELGTKHPECYSLVNGRRTNLPADTARRGWQLCTSNPELIDEYARRINARLEQDPDIRMISISPNDGGSFCECARCRALDRPQPDWYARYSDRLAVFNNEVARRVGGKHPRVTVKCGAYAMYLRVPADRTWRAEANLAVQVCHTYACYNHAVEDGRCEFNRDCFRGELENWAKLTQRLFIYEYYYKGAWADLPWPMAHAVRQDLPYYHRLGAVGFYSQYSEDAFQPSAIVLYLAAKLAWNVNLDVGLLLRDYYEACYQEAAEPMRRYHERLEQAMIDYGDHVSPYKYKWPSLCAPDIFTAKVLTETGGLLTEAEALVRDEGARARLRQERVGFEYLKRALEYYQVLGEPFREVKRSDKAAWNRAATESSVLGDRKLAEIRGFLEAQGRRLSPTLAVRNRLDRIYGAGKPQRMPEE